MTRKKTRVKSIALVKEKKEEKPKVIEVPKVSFQYWFNENLKRHKVRFWQDDAILVFFKKQGLTENEIQDTYDKAFERF